MGTNYYARVNACEHCGRSEVRHHIGKSSCGWTFSFRGYRDDYELGIKILSLKDWIAYFKLGGIRVFNEYSEEQQIDEFIDYLKSPRIGKTHAEIYSGSGSWIDDEGNGFQDEYFS